jgi:hypothetical protein
MPLFYAPQSWLSQVLLFIWRSRWCCVQFAPNVSADAPFVLLQLTASIGQAIGTRHNTAFTQHFQH